MPPTLDEIKELETEWGDLRDRMDNDYKAYIGAPYTMNDSMGNPVPGLVHVTMPYGKLYAQKVIASLVKVKEQLKVEGEKLEEGQAVRIEEHLAAIFEAVGDRLRNAEEVSLDYHNIEQACIRGRIAKRILFRREKVNKQYTGMVIPDILPLDTYFMVYEVDYEGVDWYSYSQKKSKRQVKKEYNVEKTSEVEERDVYDRKRNVIYLDDEELRDQRNPYGYVPMVVQVVDSGSMLKNEGGMRYKGESIFSLARELIPEMNRLVTMGMSHNVQNFLKNYVYKSAEGKTAEPPEYPDGFKGLTVIGKDEAFDPLLSQDLQNSFRVLWAILDGVYQACTLSMTEYGSLQFPLSAVALLQLGENRDEVFLPRLQAISSAKRADCRMIIKQCQKIGGIIKLPNYEFPVSDFDGEYEIHFKYFPKNPKNDVAAYALAGNARAMGVSRDTIFKEILQFEDPEGEMALADIGELERVTPELFLFNRCHALVEKKKFLEASFILDKLKQMIITGVVPSEAGQEQPTVNGGEPESLVPMMTEGAGGGSRRPKSPLEE